MARRLPANVKTVLVISVNAPIPIHRATGDLSTQSSHDSIAVAHNMKAKVGINVLRAKVPDLMGKGLSQRDAWAFTEMAAAIRSTSAPMAVNTPIASMASAAVDPKGTESNIGIIARATVFGRALANIWRIGQDPSPESDPVGTGVSTLRRRGTYRELSYISSGGVLGSK